VDNLQDEDITEIFEKEYKLEMIKKALNDLPEKYKEVLFLKYVEHKENKQISEILDISEENVRQRISR
jgi:RNA polymerase sigma-70 factor (ECF subfamily)